MFFKNPVILSVVSALGVSAGLATAALADAPIHGSIPLPAGASQHLAKYATLSRGKAVTSARTIVPRAKVDKLVLENEDGYLVYAVFLGGHEVLVDAGNGKVLGDEHESPNSND